MKISRSGRGDMLGAWSSLGQVFCSADFLHGRVLVSYTQLACGILEQLNATLGSSFALERIFLAILSGITMVKQAV